MRDPQTLLDAFGYRPPYYRIDEHDDEPNEWLDEAYVLRGDSKVAMNREFKALFDYERVLKEFWGSEAFPLAIDRELAIACHWICYRCDYCCSTRSALEEEEKEKII